MYLFIYFFIFIFIYLFIYLFFNLFIYIYIYYVLTQLSNKHKMGVMQPHALYFGELHRPQPKHTRIVLMLSESTLAACLSGIFFCNRKNGACTRELDLSLRPHSACFHACSIQIDSIHIYIYIYLMDIYHMYLYVRYTYTPNTLHCYIWMMVTSWQVAFPWKSLGRSRLVKRSVGSQSLVSSCYLEASLCGMEPRRSHKVGTARLPTSSRCWKPSAWKLSMVCSASMSWTKRSWSIGTQWTFFPVAFSCPLDRCVDCWIWCRRSVQCIKRVTCLTHCACLLLDVRRLFQTKQTARRYGLQNVRSHVLK